MKIIIEKEKEKLQRKSGIYKPPQKKKKALYEGTSKGCGNLMRTKVLEGN